jgi:mannose-1-phosphate guanylyltransferase
MERYAVVMAGGSGTRLWPISRKDKPKQFISVKDCGSMLLLTVRRIIKSVPAERCHIITDEKLLGITRDEVAGLLPEENIIPEPEKKNTAACIAYASLILRHRFGDCLVCFLPADGYIENEYEEAFSESLSSAFDAAEKSGCMAVVGISPTYPATGYGYIAFDPGSATEVKEAFRAERFVEKPDYETARAYVDSGRYLWNSGMVVGSVESILRSVRLHLPLHYRLLADAADAAAPNRDKALRDAYSRLEPVSFDFGVLEKCGELYVVRAFFKWNDIGSLVSLSETFDSDEDGNRTRGTFVGLNSKQNVVYSEQDLVAAIGIQEMMVIHTGDAIIVCPKERAQDVRKLVEEIRRRGLEKYL